MIWTLVDDGPNINVRAIINPHTQQQERRDLIHALENHMYKEPPHDGHPLVRTGPPGPGPQAAEETPAETRPKVREISPYFDAT